jgi:hypothetical protein
MVITIAAAARTTFQYNNQFMVASFQWLGCATPSNQIQVTLSLSAP